MRRKDLVKKELLVARRRLPTLLVLLVLLPAAFAGASIVFEDVVPHDSPIAVVPGDDEVSEDDLENVRSVVALYTDAHVYTGDLDRALEREEYYAAIEVPSDLVDGGSTVVVHYHGAVVPFDEPSRLMVGALDAGLRGVGADVTVERNTVGDEIALAEYLLPVMLVALVFVLGLMYVPNDLRRERRALDRMRLDRSTTEVAAVKIGFYTVALVVPLGVFELAARYLDYSVDLLSMPVFGFLALTFLYSAFVGTTVALATGFSAYGRLVNVTILFAVVVLSNLVYPVGFFSGLRRRIAELMPSHYSAVAVRSHATKDVDAWLFADWMLGLVAFTALAAVALHLAARRYERP